MKGARLSSTKSPSGGWATLRRSPRPYFGCARRTRPSSSDTPWSSTAARPPERPDDCPRPRKEQHHLRRERQVGQAVQPPRTHPPARRCLAEAAADRPDRPVLPDETVCSIRHVRYFGVAVDLHPRAVPVVGEDQHRALRVPFGVAGLHSGRIGGDDDPAPVVHTTGHRRDLRAAVPAVVASSNRWRGRTKSSNPAKSTVVLVAIDPAIKRLLLARVPAGTVVLV